MRQKSGSNRRHDNVVMVGQVEGTTIQVLTPDGAPDKFMWRIIKKEGRDVTSGMIFYATPEAAMEAALLIVIPDAVPVEYREPQDSDYEALNMLLFGFKKGDPINSFQAAFAAFQFLTETLKVLKAALDLLPGDFDQVAESLASSPDVDFDQVTTLRSIEKLTIQGQEVMVMMCERDLETLGAFIQEFLVL